MEHLLCTVGDVCSLGERARAEPWRHVDLAKGSEGRVAVDQDGVKGSLAAFRSSATLDARYSFSHRERSRQTANQGTNRIMIGFAFA